MSNLEASRGNILVVARPRVSSAKAVLTREHRATQTSDLALPRGLPRIIQLECLTCSLSVTLLQPQADRWTSGDFGHLQEANNVPATIVGSEARSRHSEARESTRLF